MDDPSLRVYTMDTAPAHWDRFLQRVPTSEFAAGSLWTELAARHYRNARPCWVVAERSHDGLVGGMPLLVKRRFGLRRLESSFDGTVAGPQIAADLPSATRDLVAQALMDGLNELVEGRTVLAAVTVADPDMLRMFCGMRTDGRRSLQSFQSAVVDCRPGLAHIESEAWTKNRRNERNRGLRRGCTLHCERDPAAVERWYPIYLALARRWAQAPVPMGFLTDLMSREPARVCLNSVKLKGRMLGGHFCLISRNRLLPFLSGAEDAYQKSHFVSTLLYWQAMLVACEAGLDAVDFGGCVGKDSLWDFKRRCGGVAEHRLQLQIRSRLGRSMQAAALIRRRLRGGGG
jgi:CelD/BcsL family acetyltransferase involved in cellulose biosynthesis